MRVRAPERVTMRWRKSDRNLFLDALLTTIPLHAEADGEEGECEVTLGREYFLQVRFSDTRAFVGPLRALSLKPYLVLSFTLCFRDRNCPLSNRPLIVRRTGDSTRY